MELELVLDLGIVRRVGGDGDVGVVLRRGSQERHAPDIDELFPVRSVRKLVQVRFERVQVDRDQVDRHQPPTVEFGHRIRGSGGEDPPEEPGMQRLDPTPEPRTDPRQFLGSARLDPLRTEAGPGPFGGHDLRPKPDELPGQFGEARRVGNGEQRPSDRCVGLVEISTIRYPEEGAETRNKRVEGGRPRRPGGPRTRVDVSRNLRPRSSGDVRRVRPRAFLTPNFPPSASRHAIPERDAGTSRRSDRTTPLRGER